MTPNLLQFLQTHRLIYRLLAGSSPKGAANTVYKPSCSGNHSVSVALENALRFCSRAVGDVGDEGQLWAWDASFGLEISGFRGFPILRGIWHTTCADGIVGIVNVCLHVCMQLCNGSPHVVVYAFCLNKGVKGAFPCSRLRCPSPVHRS